MIEVVAADNHIPVKTSKLTMKSIYMKIDLIKDKA